MGKNMGFMGNMGIMVSKDTLWLAMISCKDYPFSIHIEILLMMTQINKAFVILILFYTAAREIEDLIHNC